jgi:alkylation response protein AidB-like acyl-CoA dehydrogenase/flavin-dependent dehydrogenase/electron transfer flavoprotein alpha subunit/ferredoxin-like protein FixX
MNHYQFDVVIIGAGPAGVAAAGSLAGAGITVALLDAGVYAGAENWSGCVYFTENLAEVDCFGPESVEAAPFERRVTRRGTLMHNGLDVIGIELTSQDTFKNCYTVLRPVYDPYFALLARNKGAVHITGTTVTSLIRKGGKVIGVQTNRGPLHAGVIFLAEGDASHLVCSEQLERVTQPHFLQGVKAVLSLTSQEIENRFRLEPGKGAAYEILLRNPSISGRTAKLNIGGFLYTNRDSLSIGYVVPLDNVRNHYRGGHDTLFEWMRGLPYLRELTEGASLSAYGTKIIRSGGWRERPVLVQDGLAIGGASTGLGVDLPFPNFTGPASASGLYFARAVKSILKRGGAFDAKTLDREYLAPLLESVYGKNARYLAAWPGYFGKSNVLFARTVDIACGSIHFLSEQDLVETGRFLRSHVLSLRGLKEVVMDMVHALSALRLWKPLAKSSINPLMIIRWFTNLFKRAPTSKRKLDIILQIAGKKTDAASLPWPVGPLIKRLSPALLDAFDQIYASDSHPAEKKFSHAVRSILRVLNLTDFIILPVFALFLTFLALGTAIWDAIRFYVFKTPADKLLKEPVMAYNESLRKVRDLDGVKPTLSLEAKLATNTYHVVNTSHIMTLWPEAIPSQPEMSHAALWWICPARVYVYDAPLAGRGKVTINFENCIKCESCWRAEPQRALWGRHTDHKLIFRPDSAAIPILLHALRDNHPLTTAARRKITSIDDKIWYLNEDTLRTAQEALYASSAFLDAVLKLPSAIDKGRRAWPLALGKRLAEKILRLEVTLSNDGRYVQAEVIQFERDDLDLKLEEGRLLQALYVCRRFEQKILSWVRGNDALDLITSPVPEKDLNLRFEEIVLLFPDHIVKSWEEASMPEEWAETLRQFILDHRNVPLEAVRALSSVSPALGMIAAHQLVAIELLTKAGIEPGPGICAVAAGHLDITEDSDSVRIRGSLSFIPAAASHMLLLVSKGKAYLAPLAGAGMTVSPLPAIGFKAAALSQVSLDLQIKRYTIALHEQKNVPDAAFYLAIALGAADYLCRRIKEHAVDRVQFPGQMLDTEGRDGIAKLGAVKALIGRTESWRLMLETFFGDLSQSAFPSPHAAYHNDLLIATIAAMAFSPEPGAIGYDAGQVFGGFAYSEDDLLARFYRDSSLFRFLAPGYGASTKLHVALGSLNADIVFSVFGDLGKIKNEPLRNIVHHLSTIENECSSLSKSADPGLTGEAKAVIIGIRRLLINIEKGLNEGRSKEREAAAAEVLLGLAEDALQKARLSAGRGRVSPYASFPVEPGGTPITLEQDYESFCRAPGAPHLSGSFLISAFDRALRFVPEMQLHDTHLRNRWSELTDWFKKNCRGKKFDGLFIERYIEKIHGLPDEVIEAVKNNKWLATYIPKSEDGLGWRKAEYYILNSAAGSFGDAAIDLLIMASTSIGTTPILLGLEDELPRVRQELVPLIQETGILGEIGTGLNRIILMLSNPNPSRLKNEYGALMKLVDGRVRRTRVAKYLAANFLRSFYSAGIAGQRGDLTGFITNLKYAGVLFENVIPDIHAALEELPRRERCHKLFLRYLGHGGVSAFALTEPTAGSDSGGVKTTAKLETVTLLPRDDGRYAFLLQGQHDKKERYLIDADKIVFTDQGIAYQTPDGQTCAIKYDHYDYAMDRGTRYYLYQGETCEFHDIGQVRKTTTGLMYEYYSLTGAKMWITNGSIATQFSLFAQTSEGVTGFMVDRYSEGLKVGADEKKMGQRGSPTNEISIDSVRVPREAVIGYEGHGQVNALETLNVGRCGLSVVSGALMRKLLEEARQNIPSTPVRDLLLGEAAAIMFGSESLAYYLVGLFDRPHESVRMESAIAKYICSEDIHELISLVENAYGPSGQTEKLLLEKARRDARILTIYEGTNEVQRFLILKDLIAMAPAWPEIPMPKDAPASRTLAEWKNKLRGQVKDMAGLLGDASWSDAMLQPTLFPVAEMAAEVLRLDCIYYRIEWLGQRRALLDKGDPDYVLNLLDAGNRAVERSLARLAYLNNKYSSALILLRENNTMPEVRAADSALDAFTGQKRATDLPLGNLRTRLNCLVIVRPVAELSPRPKIVDDALQEIVWQLDPRDLSGLVQMLELKHSSDSDQIIDVLMPGGPEFDHLLRAAAGARADKLHRISIDPAAGSASYIKTIKDLEVLRPFDLIVVGADCLNGDRGLGAFLAGCFKKNHYRRDRIETTMDGIGLNHVVLPAVISMTSLSRDKGSTMTAAVAAAFSDIRVIEPSMQESSTVSARYELLSGKEAATKSVTNTALAAIYLKAFAASTSTATAEKYNAPIKEGSLSQNSAVWALLDTYEQKSNVAVLRAARLTADLTGRKVHSVISAPKGMWPKFLGIAKAQGCEQAFCVDTHEGRLSPEGRRKIVHAVQKTTDMAFLFAGPGWTDELAYVAGELNSTKSPIFLCFGVLGIEIGFAAALAFTIEAYEGKLVRRFEQKGGSAFITTALEADFPIASRERSFGVAVLDFAIEPEFIMPLPPVSAPTLSQADVIIDLGYGIKDKAGLELAEKLKTKLEALGLTPMFGATRKVTQDLKLLPLEAQIGQTGVRVNPKLIIALGISGAPQHIDYIGSRAEILCFNKDPEAPLMKLNQTRSALRVHPIAGDLFVSVKELITKLE